MNLFNRKLLQSRIAIFDFPERKELQKKIEVIDKWQKSLKDSDLGKTKEKSVQMILLTVINNSE